MKTIYRIPTEMYSFIEMEGDEESFEVALEKYRQMTALVKGEVGEGLDQKEMNRVYDEYRSTGQIADGAEVYEKMNATQRIEIQALKRSLARTKNK
jgi:hypothetical protein